MTTTRRPHAYRAPAPAKAPPNAERLSPNAGALGAAVQTLAQHRGLSLMALARAAAPEGKSDVQEIYRIARGQCREIKVGWLLRVCRALACDPDALLRLAGLWPTAAIDDRRSTFGDDGDGWSEEALLDFRLGEAEDTVARWPDGARSAALRVLEALVPLSVVEESAQESAARGA